MPTLSLSVTVPSSAEVNDFVAYHGWTAQIPDPNNPGQMIDNPETKAQFSKRMVIRFIRSSIKAKRANDAAETARLAQIALAEALEMT